MAGFVNLPHQWLIQPALVRQVSLVVEQKLPRSTLGPTMGAQTDPEHPTLHSTTTTTKDSKPSLS